MVEMVAHSTHFSDILHIGEDSSAICDFFYIVDELSVVG